MTFLDVFKDGLVEFYPRMAFPEIMKQMQQLNPVIIGHQIYNDQNYLSLEALYLGYPLVHNSNSIRNAGFFYEGWQLHDGVRELEVVSESFFKPEFFASYLRRCRKVLADHATDNPTLLEQLTSLPSRLKSRPWRDRHAAVLVSGVVLEVFPSWAFGCCAFCS